MTSPLHSIRWRLQLWHAAILLVVIGALCAAVYHSHRENELWRIDRELSAAGREVFFSLVEATGGRPAPPPEIFEKLSRGEARMPAAVAATYQGDAPGYAYFSFRDRDDRVLLQSPNVPPDAVTLPVPATGVVEKTRTIDRRRELSRSNNVGLRLVIGRDISPELEERRRFAWSLAAQGLGLWLFGLLGGWWLAGRAIRPIESISRTATRIAEGNLDERISVEKGAGELRDLGGVLNRTFDRLRQTLELQRQFTADAAHELRTPITILTAETQRILKRERTADEYRATFETCSQTIARMRRLVEDLLLLARQETAAAPSEPCDLGDILRESIAHLAPLAAARDIAIQADLQSAPCVGHPSALATVANNLLANAIQHHPGHGQIHISTRGENGAALTIRDDGPGITAEDLPHIFDRFYRADTARTADASLHTGLGLAIVKTIVDAHAGTITCQSTPGEGAVFKATFRAGFSVRGGHESQ